VGRTDSDGEILIPDLLSYQNNKVGLDIGDLPLDYQVPAKETSLVPRFRSGVFHDFRVKRFKAVTGQVIASKAGKEIVLRLGRLTLTAAGEERSCPTGFNGEFYLENLPAGRHIAALLVQGERYRCPIDVPESEDLLVETGEVICEQVDSP